MTGTAGNTVVTPEGGTAQPFPNSSSPRNFGQSSTAFNSYVDITPSTITFESSNTNAGPFIRTESFSQVQFDFTNPEPTNTPVTFESTITPAGLGFYLADASTGCLPSQCPQISALTDFDFGDIAPSLDLRGEVGFTFEIFSSAAERPLYELSGSLSLFAGDGAWFVESEAFNAAAAVLQATPTTLSGIDFGYLWDARHIEMLLPNVGTQTITYKTTVYSLSNGGCLDGSFGCLVAYSGFGDPIGRGGDASFAEADFSSFATLDDGPVLFAGGIEGVDSSPSVFNVPTFQNGRLSFVIQDTAVPEPATWAMMITGFGLLGGVMRRRRVLAHA